MAGAFKFRFRCDSELTVATYESIFRDLEGCEAAAEIEVSHESRRAYVRRPGRPHFGIPREDLVPWEVLRQVNLASLDADAERIHVHGAGLIIDGSGTLIVAPSGTGKTTTAALLTATGAEYLTDEMVGFRKEDGYLGQAFPKPFSIKEDHHPAVASIAALGERAAIGEELVSIVPASLIGPVTTSLMTVELVVFLDRSGRESSHATHVHSANAAAELALQSMDIRRAGANGFLALAHVASRAKCVALSAGGPQEAAETIIDLANSGPAESIQTTPVPHVEGPGSIAWVDFGEALAFHASTTGLIGSLHGADADAWRRSETKDEQLLRRLSSG